MIILQIFIGLFAAVGIGCILADLMKVPTMKASKAANNLGKKGDKKTSIIEIYLKEFATKLSEKLKLNEYKKAQLEADLRSSRGSDTMVVQILPTYSRTLVTTVPREANRVAIVLVSAGINTSFHINF